MAHISNDSLQIMPLYNRSVTYGERPRGIPFHYGNSPGDFGITDPLRGAAFTYSYPEPTTLVHPQRSFTLAQNINQKVLQRMTKYRLQGSFDVSDFHGPGVPFDAKAGDLVVIGDFVPPVGAQRIASINYNSDGTATVTLDRYFDLEDTLRRARHHVRRHRR
jgi:hypothetical protein